MAPHILVVSQTARLHIFTLYTSSYCENYRLKNSQGSLTDHNLLIHILTRALKARCMSALGMQKHFSWLYQR